MNTKSYKVGSVVLATEQGLGYLAKSFYDHGLIDKVMIREHSNRTNHHEWYGDDVVTRDELLKCDTLLFFEEVFDWRLIVDARRLGIKTILIPMYECTRSPLPYFPDLILVPSELDKLYYPDSKLVTIPVDVPWKLRKTAHTFVHNAGNGGIGGRNGTREIIEALPHIRSPFKLIIRSQIPIPEITDPRVEVRIGTFDDIWAEGDVFLFPEKFNGLSLPIQEAYASGMLVMASNRVPNSLYLPTEPLIPVSGFKTECIAVEFDSAIIDPTAIAEIVDLWYNKDIESFSLIGKQWGLDHSWEALKTEYVNLLKPCEK